MQSTMGAGNLIRLIVPIIVLVMGAKTSNGQTMTCPGESTTKTIRPGVLCLPEVKCAFGDFCVQNSMPTAQMPLQYCCDACELGPPIPWRSCGKKGYRKDEHGRDVKHEQDCPYGYKCTFPSGDAGAPGVCCPDPYCPPTCENRYSVHKDNCTDLLGKECPEGLQCEVRDGFKKPFPVCCTKCDSHAAPIPGLVCLANGFDEHFGVSNEHLECPKGFECKANDYEKTGHCCPVNEKKFFKKCRLLNTTRDGIDGDFPLEFCDDCPFNGLLCEFTKRKKGECCTQCPGGVLPIPQDIVDCSKSECPPGYHCYVDKIHGIIRSAVCCPNHKDIPKKKIPPHCPEDTKHTTSGRKCLGVIGKKCPEGQFCHVEKECVHDSFCCNPCKNGVAIPGKSCKDEHGNVEECPKNYICVMAHDSGVCCPDPDSPPKCQYADNALAGSDCEKIIGKACPFGLLCEADSYRNTATCCNPCEIGAPIPEEVCIEGTDVQCPAGFECVGTTKHSPGFCCPDLKTEKFPRCDLVDSKYDNRVATGEKCGCKPGFQCECDEDKFGDCCNPCEFGAPLPPTTPGVYCGNPHGGDDCPDGYECFTQGGGVYKVCCPKHTPPTERVPHCDNETKSGEKFGCEKGQFYQIDKGICCYPCKTRTDPGPPCFRGFGRCPDTYKCVLPTFGKTGICCKDGHKFPDCPKKVFIKEPGNCDFGVPLRFPPCSASTPCPPGYLCKDGDCCFNKDRPPNCRKTGSTFFPINDCVQFIGHPCPAGLMCERFDKERFARCCNPCDFGNPIDDFECSKDHVCPFGFWCTGKKFGVCCPDKPPNCHAIEPVDILPGSYCNISIKEECAKGFLCGVALIPNSFPKAECCNPCEEGHPLVGRTCTPEPIGAGCPSGFACVVGSSGDEGSCCPVFENLCGDHKPVPDSSCFPIRGDPNKGCNKNEKCVVTNVEHNTGICCKRNKEEFPPCFPPIGAEELYPPEKCKELIGEKCPPGYSCQVSLDKRAHPPARCCNPCPHKNLHGFVCHRHPTAAPMDNCPNGFECITGASSSRGTCCEVDAPLCKDVVKGGGEVNTGTLCKGDPGVEHACPVGLFCKQSNLPFPDTEESVCCNVCDRPEDFLPGVVCNRFGGMDECPEGFKCKQSVTNSGFSACCRDPDCPPICKKMKMKKDKDIDGKRCEDVLGEECPEGLECEIVDGFRKKVAICCTPCKTNQAPIPGRVCKKHPMDEHEMCPTGFDCLIRDHDGVCCPDKRKTLDECRLLGTSRDGADGDFPLEFCDDCPFRGLLCEFTNSKDGKCCTQCPGHLVPIPQDIIDCGTPPYLCPPGYECNVDRVHGIIRTAVCCPIFKDVPKVPPPPHCADDLVGTTSGDNCGGSRCPSGLFCQTADRQSESYCCDVCKIGTPIPDKVCGTDPHGAFKDCPKNYICVTVGGTGVCCPDPNSPPKCKDPYNTRSREECKHFIGKECPFGLLCETNEDETTAVCCNPCDIGAPIPDEVCLEGTNVQCPAGYLCVGTFKNSAGVCCPDPHTAKFPRCDLVDSKYDNRVATGEDCGCKPGFQCECDEDKFGDCCNPCEFGAPLPPTTPGVYCGNPHGGDQCPNGYECFTQAGGAYKVCCPLHGPENKRIPRIPHCTGKTLSGIDFGCDVGLFYQIGGGKCCFPCKTRAGIGPACFRKHPYCPDTYKCVFPSLYGNRGYCCKDGHTFPKCPKREFFLDPENCPFGLPLPPSGRCKISRSCPHGYTCIGDNCCFNPVDPPKCRKVAATFFARDDCLELIGNPCPAGLACEKRDDGTFARCCNRCEFGSPLSDFECSADHACPKGFSCQSIVTEKDDDDDDDDDTDDFGVCCPDKPRSCHEIEPVDIFPRDYCEIAIGKKCFKGFLCGVSLVPNSFPKAECCNPCDQGHPIFAMTCAPEPLPGARCPADHDCVVGDFGEEGVCCPKFVNPCGEDKPVQGSVCFPRRFGQNKGCEKNQRCVLTDEEAKTGICCKNSDKDFPPCYPRDFVEFGPRESCPKDAHGRKCPPGYLCSITENSCCNPCDNPDDLIPGFECTDMPNNCPTGFMCRTGGTGKGGCCRVPAPLCADLTGYEVNNGALCEGDDMHACPLGQLCAISMTNQNKKVCCNPCDVAEHLLPGVVCDLTGPDTCPMDFECQGGAGIGGFSGCCRVT